MFNLTADGSKVISISSAGLTFVSLDSLEVETIAFEPFYIQLASATPDPNKLLLAGFTRTLMGQREKYYLFSISNQILMPITADGRHMGAVEVNVRRSSKPIVLVLSAYEPVQWKLKLAPGAQLSTVLVSGYYPSQVTGAGGARTVIIGREYAYKLGSAEYNRLNQQVMMWTGRTIDVFQGLYEGSSFSVGG